MAINQESSKKLEQYNSILNLGLGLGLGTEKGTFELIGSVYVDGRKNISYQSTSQSYSQSGYEIGLEYNKLFEKTITLGGGLFYHRYDETFANNDSYLTNSNIVTNSASLAFIVKAYMKGIRPFFRIHLENAINTHSIVFGFNLISKD